MRTDADHPARVRDPAIELLLGHTATLADAGRPRPGPSRGASPRSGSCRRLRSARCGSRSSPSRASGRYLHRRTRTGGTTPGQPCCRRPHRDEVDRSHELRASASARTVSAEPTASPVLRPDFDVLKFRWIGQREVRVREWLARPPSDEIDPVTLIEARQAETPRPSGSHLDRADGSRAPRAQDARYRAEGQQLRRDRASAVPGTHVSTKGRAHIGDAVQHHVFREDLGPGVGAVGDGAPRFEVVPRCPAFEDVTASRSLDRQRSRHRDNPALGGSA